MAQNGGDREMHLFSFEFNGAIKFVIYNKHGNTSPFCYVRDGVSVPPIIEISLRYYSGKFDHFNLLGYELADGTKQLFWKIDDESPAHKQLRKDMLIAARIRRDEGEEINMTEKRLS